MKEVALRPASLLPLAFPQAVSITAQDNTNTSYLGPPVCNTLSFRLTSAWKGSGGKSSALVSDFISCCCWEPALGIVRRNGGRWWCRKKTSS